ncbi:ATP-binding cassette domain-containing protein [bacterium]|nr:ATP-binding cassette domain-containing protein [bacterium]
MVSSVLNLVERISTALGTPFDQLRATEVIQSNLGNRDASIETLVPAIQQLGIDARFDHRPLRDVLSFVRPSAPIVVMTQKCPGGVLVLNVDSSQVSVLEDTSGPSQWISNKEMLQRLGLKSMSEPVDVVLIQAALPYQHLRNEEHPHGMTPVNRLFALLRTERSDVISVIIYVIAIGVLSLATPLAVESLVTSIAFGGLLQPLLIVSLLLFGSLAFAALLRIMQTILVEYLQRRIFVRLVADLSYRLPRAPVAAFDTQYGPELLNRFFDIVTVQKVCSVFLLEGISLFLSTLIGAVLLAVYHPYLLLYDIVLIAAMVGIVFLLGRGAIRTSINESLTKYSTADLLQEMVRSNLAFKLGAGPELAVNRGDQAARAYLSARERHFAIVIRQVIFALGLQAIASTVLLGLGGYLVISGQLTLGQLVAAELIVTVVIGSFTKIGKHLESFYDLIAAMDKIGHLIDLPEEESGHEEISSTAQGLAISFRSVRFSYDSREAPLFENIQIQIASGEKVAIVGPSGRGKSTLVDLMAGIRFPTSGSVLIDDIDSRVVHANSLRSTVAIVRDLDFVSGSIIDNIRMGRADVTSKQVSEVLHHLDLIEDIAHLPEGLNTTLLPSGAPLSRGQAYRVLIARALLAMPKLILIDGVLDSLPDELRAKVVERLFDRKSGSTAIVVSQCREVIDRAERVITIERQDHRSILMSEANRGNLHS